MREKNTKDSILDILRGSEPLNFEPLYEKAKKIEYCSRMTFAAHLQELVDKNVIKKEKISGRNVKYSYVKTTDQGKKILENQRKAKKQLDELLQSVKEFKYFKKKGVKRTEFIRETAEELLGLIETMKAFAFLEVSGMIKPSDSVYFRKIEKDVHDSMSLIFKEIQKKDEPMYNVIRMNIFFKIVKVLNSMK